MRVVEEWRGVEIRTDVALYCDSDDDCGLLLFGVLLRVSEPSLEMCRLRDCAALNGNT
jgi:hypothetical protein